MPPPQSCIIHPNSIIQPTQTKIILQLLATCPENSRIVQVAVFGFFEGQAITIRKSVLCHTKRIVRVFLEYCTWLVQDYPCITQMVFYIVFKGTTIPIKNKTSFGGENILEVVPAIVDVVVWLLRFVLLFEQHIIIKPIIKTIKLWYFPFFCNHKTILLIPNFFHPIYIL